MVQWYTKSEEAGIYSVRRIITRSSTDSVTTANDHRQITFFTWRAVPGQGRRPGSGPRVNAATNSHPSATNVNQHVLVGYPIVVVGGGCCCIPHFLSHPHLYLEITYSLL